MTTTDQLLRPAVLGAIADDDHAPHVVATVERLAALHDLRPVYVHDCGHYVAAPVTCHVGDPYEEPPIPTLTFSEAENAFAAWRNTQPILAHANVPQGRAVHILAGGPPSRTLREHARKLRPAAIVVGRGAHRPRVLGFLAGSTALGLARACPAPVLFVDDRPLPLDGPIVCVLPPDRGRWNAPLHSASTLAARAAQELHVYALEPSTGEAPRGLAIEPTPLRPDGDVAASIAALVERHRAGLVLVDHAPEPALRTILRGSLCIDLLLDGQTPLMLCSPDRAPSSG